MRVHSILISKLCLIKFLKIYPTDEVGAVISKNIFSIISKSILFPILFFNSLIANAFTLDDYKESLKEGGKRKDYMEMYVMGMGQGFHWANSAIKSNLEKQIFCAPSNLRINGNLILTMMSDGVGKTTLSGSSPLELYMLQQLNFTFPCK